MESGSNIADSARVGKLRNLMLLFRPATLIAPATGALLMALLAISQSHIALTLDVYLKLAIGMLILAMSNAAGNVINHVVDADDTDAYHPIKRTRAIVSGKVNRMDAISLTVFIFGAAMVISYVIFGVLTGILMSIILFFAWAYSAPPRFKKRFIMGNLAIGTPRGFLGVVTAYSFFAYPTFQVLAFGLIMGVYVFGVNTTKDIGDEIPDRMAGIHNFVTVLGVNKAKKYIITPFLYIPFILWLIYLLAFDNYWQGYILFAALPISIAINHELMHISSNGMENDRTWYMFYGQMAAMIMLFTLPLL